MAQSQPSLAIIWQLAFLLSRPFLRLFYVPSNVAKQIFTHSFGSFVTSAKIYSCKVFLQSSANFQKSSAMFGIVREIAKIFLILLFI